MSQKKPSPQRISTMQIKMGLEKIKLAQLEVLKQLRRQNSQYHQYHAQPENRNPRQNSLINHQNLEGLTKKNNEQKIQSLKRQLIQEREKSIDNTNHLYKRMGQLQTELTKRGQKQLQLKKQISRLEKELLTKDDINQEKVRQNKKINQIADSWHNQLKDLQKAYEKQKLKNRQWNQKYSQLQRDFSILSKQNDEFKKKAQSENKKKNQHSVTNNAETGVYDKRKSLQIEKVISELRKINASHDRMFDRLKTLTNIQSKDMDMQEQYQNAFNRTITLIENLQKYIGKKSQIQESAILSNIAGKYQFEGSFREDIKKIQKQLYGNQDIIQQNAKLKEQVKSLKQKIEDHENDKKFLQNRLANLRSQLKQTKQKVFSLENLKFIDGLSSNREIQDQPRHSKSIQKLTDANKRLQKQLKQLKAQLVDNRKKNSLQRSRSQGLQQMPETKARVSQSESQKKNILSILKEFQQNDEHNDNQQVKQKVKLIIEMNSQVRKQNISLKKQIQLYLLDIQTLKLEKDQLQNSSKNQKSAVTNFINENARLRQLIKKLQNQINGARNKNFQLSSKIQIFQRNVQVKERQYEGLLQNRTNEINMLRKQNDNYFKQHRDLVKCKDQYSKLEADFITMSRNAKKIDVAVDHLWQIKQTEYQNIGVILKMINGIKQ